MSPCRESFGEEWVDMDEEEENSRKSNLVQANVDRSGPGGGYYSGKDINEMEKSVHSSCTEASIQPSRVCMGSRFESKRENSLIFQSSKEKFILEMEFEISAACESQENVEEEILQTKGNRCLENNTENHLEVERFEHDVQDRIPSKEPCSRRASGEGERFAMMRRVMSEARFMCGQVMMSKSESIQSTMSKRAYSKAKEGTFSNNWGNGETMAREKRETDEGEAEVVLNIKGSDETRDNGSEDGSEEIVGAHQAPSMGCATPVDASHTCPSTSKEVCKDQMALKVVCTQPNYTPEDSCKYPTMSKGSKMLNEVQLQSEALEVAQAHSEVASKHMATLETQMQSKTKEAVNGRMKASVEAHMPVEKLKATQMHTKAVAVAAAATCQVNDSEVFHMQLNESKEPTKVTKPCTRRVKALEMLHMGSEKSAQREKVVGKQASGGQLEVEEVECECCGLGEECSIGYIEHVKAVFSGHWVCGLCAEAVHEERHRLGKGVPMEEAVRTHMNLCKQFSSKKKVGELPHGIGVAHAVCHLLSRHLSSPTSPRQISPVRPLLSRTSSCLPSFSHDTPCTT